MDDDLTPEEHHRLDLLIDCPDCTSKRGEECVIDGEVSTTLVHARRRLWRLLLAPSILN
jgi:hypothetical protein